MNARIFYVHIRYYTTSTIIMPFVFLVFRSASSSIAGELNIQTFTIAALLNRSIFKLYNTMHLDFCQDKIVLFLFLFTIRNARLYIVVSFRSVVSGNDIQISLTISSISAPQSASRM